MKQNLENLIYLREEELMDMEYPHGRMCRLKKYWNEFKKYCKNKDIDYFIPNMVDGFLSDNYSDINNKTTKEAMRSMKVLLDIDFVNEYLPYKPKGEDELSEYYRNLLHDYLNFYKTIRNNSATTLKDKSIETIKFFIYLQDNDVPTIKNLTKVEVLKYIESNNKCKLNARISINWNLRSLFLYLNDSDILLNTFSFLLPKIKRIKQRKLPATFEKDDVIKIIDYLKNERGKTIASYRNYAMILIAAKLGIRKIDIINLKWNNIDWENNCINIIQIKTKKQLSLPLPNDVGEAIIEYIQKERPFKIRSKDENIFIRHRFPLVSLNSGFSLTETVKTALINSGVSVDKYQQIGLHSFRFTLATELLNEETSADIISSVLGHYNPNSQKSYTRVNRQNLRKCFVEANYE